MKAVSPDIFSVNTKFKNYFGKGLIGTTDNAHFWGNLAEG